MVPGNAQSNAADVRRQTNSWGFHCCCTLARFRRRQRRSVAAGWELGMGSSNKPVIWGLFAAGGTVAAFVVPILILITCLGIPLGLLSADVLSYEHCACVIATPVRQTRHIRCAVSDHLARRPSHAHNGTRSRHAE